MSHNRQEFASSPTEKRPCLILYLGVNAVQRSAMLKRQVHMNSAFRANSKARNHKRKMVNLNCVYHSRNNMYQSGDSRYRVGVQANERRARARTPPQIILNYGHSRGSSKKTNFQHPYEYYNHPGWHVATFLKLLFDEGPERDAEVWMPTAGKEWGESWFSQKMMIWLRRILMK